MQVHKGWITDSMTTSWTGVQIATLAVEALTPLTVAGVGVLVARTGRRIEQVQWANQIVVTRRLDIFSQIAPGLNKLLCFGTFVGGWKEIEPREAINIKRQLDEAMYANQVLFSEELFARYLAFMRTLFAMYATADADAPICAPIESSLGNRRNMPWWEDSMTRLFSLRQVANRNDIRTAYEQLAEEFRAELYVTRQERPILKGQGAEHGQRRNLWGRTIKGLPNRDSRPTSAAKRPVDPV
jgi:hypothetical protein